MNRIKLEGRLLGGLAIAAVAACDPSMDTHQLTADRSLTTELGTINAVASIEDDLVRVTLYDQDFDVVLHETESVFDPTDEAFGYGLRDDQALDAYLLTASSRAAVQWEAAQSTDDHLPPDCNAKVYKACMDVFCEDGCGESTADTCAAIAIRSCDIL